MPNPTPHISEIHLAAKSITPDSWHELIHAISNFQGHPSSWQLFVTSTNQQIRYFIATKHPLPTILSNQPEFIFKKTNTVPKTQPAKTGLPYLATPETSLLDIIQQEQHKNQRQLQLLKLHIASLTPNHLLSSNTLYLKHHSRITKHQLCGASLPQLLALDFAANHNFFYKKPPRTLNIQKSLHLLQSNPQNTILKIETFPYLSGDYYLNQTSYSFDKHSLVVGASGSGKTTFLNLLASHLASNPHHRLKYKAIVIDPHAAITNDIGGLANTATIDFVTNKDSIQLFDNSQPAHPASIELTTNLFQSFLADHHNPRLERVLRHSIHLLLVTEQLQFDNLRRLLQDTEYRTSLLSEHRRTIPDHITAFFLTDFITLKSQSHTEAISPIIALIDELQLVPVLNQNSSLTPTLKDTIQNHFLTIFSLDRITLGDKPLQTIASLLMQQIMQLIQSKTFNQHLILMIDEVSIVENPILIKFLSEARKYNLSVILAQQYFDQISSPLKSAIFANTANYHIFRVAQSDAALLSNHLHLKLSSKDTPEERIKLLTNLKDRECVSQVISNGVVLPAFKAITQPFAPVPRPPKTPAKSLLELVSTNLHPAPKTAPIQLTSKTNLIDLLRDQSSSRLDVRKPPHD